MSTDAGVDAAASTDGSTDSPTDSPAMILCGDGVAVAGEYCLRLSSTPLSAPQDSVSSVAAGDLNEDGYLDIAVANVSGLVLFLSTGPAQFAAGAPVALIDAVSVRIADMDGDSNLDLAVGRQLGTNSVTVLWGAGNGTFPQQVSIANTVSSTVSRIVLGDVDGDAKTDILGSSGSTGGPSVLLLKNNGGRSFSASATAALPSNVQGGNIALGDFDGNGRPDIVSGILAGNDSTTTYVFMNSGNGSFGSAKAISSISCPGSFTSDCHIATMVAGRFNADAYDDLVLGAGGPVPKGAVVELSSGQNGLFSLPSFYALGSNLGWPVAADVNGDGALDIVFGLGQADGIQVLLGDGAGAFMPQAVLSTSPLGRFPYDLVVADINKDGELDVATANGLTKNVSLFLSNP